MSLSLLEQAGTPIPEGLPDSNVDTIFRATGLDWEVIQKPIYYDNATNHFQQNSYVSLPQFVGNFRSDNNQFLGIVHPKEYKVIQNVDAFNFIDGLDDFTFEKVGMFEDGKKVFVVGKTSESFVIDGSNDRVDMYFTFLHGHSGKQGICLLLSPIRMFCMNQLNMMMQKATFKYNISHIGDVEMKLNQIHRAINNSRGYIHALTENINELINTKFTGSMEDLVKELIPLEDNASKLVTSRVEQARGKIMNLYNYKDDISNYKGTHFGVISAVSDYISHIEPLRKTSSSTINNMFIKSMDGNLLLEKVQLLLAA